MLSLSVRASKESPKTLLQKFDIATSAAWGICAVNTIMNVEKFQSIKAFFNITLQLGFTAAYLFQYASR